MKGTVNVLDGKGHTATPFDTETPSTVADAAQAFSDALARGCDAFDTSGPDGGVAIKDRTFDPSVQSTTMVPRLAGG